MSDGTKTSTDTSASGARDRRIGLGLIAASFAVSLVFSWQAKVRSEPRPAFVAAPLTQDGIPGFPDSVALLSLIERARTLTPRKELAALSLSHLTDKGLLDLKAGASARVLFRSQFGDGPEPEREYGKLARFRYCGAQNVLLTADGIVAEADKPGTACRVGPAPVASPTCEFTTLWKQLADREPETEFMSVEYFQAQSGPAWRLVGSTGARITLGADCQRELSDEEATPQIGMPD